MFQERHSEGFFNLIVVANVLNKNLFGNLKKKWIQY